jgi:hypothetical protein
MVDTLEVYCDLPNPELRFYGAWCACHFQWLALNNTALRAKHVSTT